MGRKLVTIRKILKIEEIKNSDFLELVHVGGWQAVVQKGIHKLNDLVLYAEIDSFFPIKEQYEFLRKSSYKVMHDSSEGFRIKSMKLRKVLSQGLVLSLSDYPDIDFSDTKKDYSDDLGVKLYETPVPENMSGKVIGQFPVHYCPKTDQERCQNLLDELEEYSKLTWEVTEKLDGCSVTFINKDNKFHICSRNLELVPHDNLVQQKINIKYKIEEQLKQYNLNLAIQGELIGPKIQNNPYELKEKDYYVFDVYDINNQRYYTSHERLLLCKGFNFKHVPLMSDVDLKMNDIITELNPNESNKLRLLNCLLKCSEGKSELNKNTTREGLVFKSKELVDGNTKSFKVISNKYLLRKVKK